jgi:short-subunit dehydrogenase
MMTRLFAQDMVQDKLGYILNVSSISAVMPYPGISVYGPTKSYVRMFSKAIRTELSIYNVKVSCLLPGATETGLYDPNRINITLAKKLGVMQTADYVANKAIVGLFGNKSEIIPGIINKLIVYLLPLFPNILVKFLFKNTDLISKGNNALD